MNISSNRAGVSLLLFAVFFISVMCDKVLYAASDVSADQSNNALTLESGPKQVSLLELYTSEGCSSCPPAEAWLSGLKQDSGLWKSFVPISFHVDYWNNLGWPDLYSSPEFTARQHHYASEWHSPSLYTPEFVLNGREWHLSDGLSSSVRLVGNLRASVSRDAENETVQVEFQPVGTLTGPFVAEVALLADGVGSQIQRGENAGRSLQHDFLCVTLQRQSMEPAADGHYRVSFTLPRQTKVPAAALAIWVHSADSLTPIQSVGGWLK